jgi:hypothetical protein
MTAPLGRAVLAAAGVMLVALGHPRGDLAEQGQRPDHHAERPTARGAATEGAHETIEVNRIHLRPPDG